MYLAVVGRSARKHDEESKESMLESKSTAPAVRLRATAVVFHHHLDSHMDAPIYYSRAEYIETVG